MDVRSGEPLRRKNSTISLNGMTNVHEYNMNEAIGNCIEIFLELQNLVCIFYIFPATVISETDIVRTIQEDWADAFNVLFIA